MDSTSNNQPTQSVKLTGSDIVFLLSMVVVVAIVTLLGMMTYKDAMKTEVTKQNGEAWVEWLTKVSAERMKPDYEIAACNAKSGDAIAAEQAAAAAPPAAPAAAGKPEENKESAAPIDGTWGACLNHIMNNTDIKDLINPFTKERPQIVAQCVPADRSLVGAIVLEKIVPTPPGSAVPTTNSQFVDSDSIENKIQIRVTVCDKGAYPIKVAELEF